MCEIEQINIRDALENYKENKNKDLSSTPQVWYTIQQQEKEFWEEQFTAELHVAEQNLEMETAAKATHAKLPKLRITPFKGTSSDWV